MVVGVLYYHFLDTQTLSSHEKTIGFLLAIGTNGL